MASAAAIAAGTPIHSPLYEVIIYVGQLVLNANNPTYMQDVKVLRGLTNGQPDLDKLKPIFIEKRWVPDEATFDAALQQAVDEGLMNSQMQVSGPKLMQVFDLLVARQKAEAQEVQDQSDAQRLFGLGVEGYTALRGEYNARVNELLDALIAAQ